MAASKVEPGKIQVPLILDEETLKEIERRRGLIPRATYVRELVKKALESGIKVV